MVMNYELSKQLKDAGFPQGTGRYYLDEDEGAAFGSAKEVEFMLSNFEAKDTPRHKFAYSPTLSELIAACGQDFARLIHHPSERKWRAVCYSQHEKDYWGSIPEEAVARLWLALYAYSGTKPS
jgi:hypothetical protein